MEYEAPSPKDVTAHRFLFHDMEYFADYMNFHMDHIAHVALSKSNLL